MVTLNDTLVIYLETYLTQRQSCITAIESRIQGHYDALAMLEEEIKGQRDEIGVLSQALGIVQSNGTLAIPTPEPVATGGGEVEEPTTPFPSDETYLERAIRVLGEVRGPLHAKDLAARFTAEGRPASFNSVQSVLDRHIRHGGTRVVKVAPITFCLPEFVPAETQADAAENQDKRWAALIAWELRNVGKPMHLNDIAGRLRRADTPIDPDTLHRVTADPDGIFERTGQKYVGLRNWKAATASA